MAKPTLLLARLVIGALAIAAVYGYGPSRVSFRYEDGKPGDGAVRTHEASIPEVKGEVYAYASFRGIPRNPVAYERGEPRSQQIVTLGEMKADTFIPAMRFGIANNKDFLPDIEQRQTFLVPWLFDGTLDYYDGYVRQQTTYDFKLKLNLKENRATIWHSGRGDDRWFLLGENIPLTSPVTSINHLRVEQYPDAPGVEDVVIQSEPWAEGERVRPQPLAKKDRTVEPGKGFQFQSMRSVWRKPGRHVRIVRQPPKWFGFPDVVQASADTLVVTHNDGFSHGGGGGLFVRHSRNLGNTWGEPIQVHPSRVNCPRLQKLRDGKLLLLADVDGGNRVVFYDSSDGGLTWKNQRFLGSRGTQGTKQVLVPSRVVELADGSWLVTTCGYQVPEKLQGSMFEVYRSLNRGQTWEFLSEIRGWPPHSPDEASVVLLPDGRLLLYARESRNDGFPAFKAYSHDGGKRWEMKELPFAVTGRPAAGLLGDGRIMVTFRSHIGRASLWAWIGEPDDDTGFRPHGIHYNDSQSVGLKDGMLHIDNDGMRGQFTQYFLRPPDSPKSTVEITAEVKVVSNSGRAATLSIPFAGKLRLYPDYVQMANNPSLRLAVSPGRFHTYRVVSARGTMKLYVDGKLAWETQKGDSRPPGPQGTWGAPTLYGPAFGNEAEGGGYWGRETQWPDVYPENISPEVTGYSIWRRVTETLRDPATGERVISWSAQKDGFPDQYQLDHIVEIEASVIGADQGYSGWTELEDGRILVVNYTDDTAPPCLPTGERRRQRIAKTDPLRAKTEPLRDGISWIRGTFVLPSDLPPNPAMPVR